MAVIKLHKVAVGTSITKKLNRDMTVYPLKPHKGAGFAVALQPGVYQMRPRKSGRICVKMKFYAPPETTPRINNPRRAIFASAVASWQALSLEQKKMYNKKAMGKHFTGYCQFLHEYLISH